MTDRPSILVIAGPTATGKTKLAELLGADATLVSADSRQVYREMNIVTGKDHATTTPLYGIDLASPAEDFSVNDWLEAVTPVIHASLNSSRNVIIVGGTGFYLSSLLNPPPTLRIPPNPTLRQQLAPLSVPQLATTLSAVDPQRLAELNQSDRHNPRRLIRAIEVARYLQSHPLPPAPRPLPSPITLIGLQPPRSDLVYKNLLRQRVLARLKLGAIRETADLLRRYSPDLPSLSAIGYRHLRAHLAGELSVEAMIDAWVKDEYLYAKRQLLFFRTKLPHLVWYDCHAPNLHNHIKDDMISTRGESYVNHQT